MLYRIESNHSGRLSSGVEQLFCKQQVTRSNRVGGSRIRFGSGTQDSDRGEGVKPGWSFNVDPETLGAVPGVAGIVQVRYP